MRGFKATHPLTEAVLRELGVLDEEVTQGWGDAAASAGFHAPEGVARCADGSTRKYSSCVDLDPVKRLWDPGFMAHAVDAGLVPFFRDWPGNKHIHIVHVGLRDSKHNVCILPGPREQIIDFTRGKNGLKGHARLTGKFAPTTGQCAAIYDDYSVWAPHVATAVLRPGGEPLPCYAFFEGGTTRVDAVAFLRALGYAVSEQANAGGLNASYHGGKAVKFEACDLKLEAGHFWRANLRSLALETGLDCKFAWAPDGNSASVQLARV